MQDTPTGSTADTADGPTDAATTELADQALATFERVWSFQLTEIDGSPILVSTLVVASLALVVGLILARTVSRYMGRRVLPRLRLEAGPASAVQSILYYLLVAMAVMLALQMAGMPLTVFTIFGGALALGIGFGSQNIVNNFMSGLILLIERPVSVGQLVEVDGLSGVVKKIGARSTVLTGYRGVDYIVPNSTLLESSVTNWQFTNKRIRSTVEVGVAYGSDTQLVKKLLLEAAAQAGEIFKEPAPAVLFNSFGDSALVFEINFWSQPESTLRRLETESELRFVIDGLFRDAGVVIAFPQQDVHLDTTRPLDVRVRRDES